MPAGGGSQRRRAPARAPLPSPGRRTSRAGRESFVLPVLLFLYTILLASSRPFPRRWQRESLLPTAWNQ
eukprot:scaffold23160_cov107-Isochrysis_galbana.AAC.2